MHPNAPVAPGKPVPGANGQTVISARLPRLPDQRRPAGCRTLPHELPGAFQVHADEIVALQAKNGTRSLPRYPFVTQLGRRHGPLAKVLRQRACGKGRPRKGARGKSPPAKAPRQSCRQRPE